MINIKKKVSLRLETKLLNALMQIYETDSISEAFTKATRTVFRSKKIADTDIYPVTKLDLLISRFNSGDTVICISVDRFLSVSQYAVFSEKV